tara:strand:- start:147 stop:389 length:243 start_codon:yes stop_codon:yes gene_type:complete
MAKKYIYSEEKVLKEFVGSILKNLIVNRKSKTIQKLLKTDPVIRSIDKSIQNLEDKISKRLQKARKNDPLLDKALKDINQ